MLTDMLKIFKFRIPPEVKFKLKNNAKCNKSRIITEKPLVKKYKYMKVNVTSI